MRANTTGRRRALDVIYEAEIKELLVPGLLRELLAERQTLSTAQVPIRGSGIDLVTLVADHLYDLDATIDRYSTWGLRRLSRVDRAVLRLGIAELRFRGVDLPVVISEYSGIVREIGSSRSIPFLTAIFNRVSEDLEAGVDPVPERPEPAMDTEAAAELAAATVIEEPVSPPASQDDPPADAHDASAGGGDAAEPEDADGKTTSTSEFARDGAEAEDGIAHESESAEGPREAGDAPEDEESTDLRAP